MPTISIDTFFACSLMVLLVLSAMAAVSKVLYPHVSSAVDQNAAERYREISKYMLLNRGTPKNWGQNQQVVPETFGLAKASADNPYELDTDKVSRLNVENLYVVSYAQIFTALGTPDVTFRIGIKQVFETAISLTATFENINETIYQFEISTEKYGVPVQAELKCYVVAQNYLEALSADTSSMGISYLNVTLSNSVDGPVLLLVFAKAVSNAKLMSFNAYAFEHNSAQPSPRGTFLRLSPLNYSLNASFIYSGTSLSTAYALTFNYSSTLTQTASNNQSATFSIPRTVEASPMMLIVTGWNSTSFFTEWTTYPQIPLQMGVDFAVSTALSNVFAYQYSVTINSAIYECTIWLGGPKE